jgi:hypothetical protein
MAFEFDNLAAFFTDFAPLEILIGPLGAQVQIKAIFDNAHHLIEDSYSAISTTQPTLICRAEDISACEQDMPVYVDGVDYLIDDIQPALDGRTYKVTLKNNEPYPD